MTNHDAADVQHARADLRRVEHLKDVASRAARQAVRRRMMILGAWGAVFIVIVGLADAWASTRWAWWIAVVVPAYIVLRVLLRVERSSATVALAKPVRRIVILTVVLDLIGVALLVPLHLLMVQPLVGDGFGSVAITAAAMFSVWTLSAWWTTR